MRDFCNCILTLNFGYKFLSQNKSPEIYNKNIMTQITLDKQINTYLGQLNLKQKKAVLTVVKTFAAEHESDLDNPVFMREMENRIEELEIGKVKGSKWEDVKLRARKTLKK